MSREDGNAIPEDNNCNAWRHYGWQGSTKLKLIYGQIKGLQHNKTGLR